jgi:uncharacterized membrane protein YfcA
MGFVVIGFLAGILAGLFGIGGGVVIVPALLVFMNMKPESATGTSLAALVLPVGILGAAYYWKHGAVDVRGALLIAAGLTLGAWLGARIMVTLPPTVAQRAFAIFLVLVAFQLWRTS